MIGSIKGVSITLNTFLDINVIQDIIIIDLPPLFGIFLSKELTVNLEGYLAIYYTHLILPFKKKYVKIPSEGTKSFHLRKIFEYNCMNDIEQVESYERIHS